MRRLPLVPLSIALCACASSPPPAPSPPSDAVAARASGNNGNTRLLTESECQSLGQWIADACHDRANMDRSAQAEGWCGEVVRGIAEGGTWVADCAKHIQYLDSVCFRGTTKVRSLMQCDS